MSLVLRAVGRISAAGSLAARCPGSAALPALVGVQARWRRQLCDDAAARKEAARHAIAAAERAAGELEAARALCRTIAETTPDGAAWRAFTEGVLAAIEKRDSAALRDLERAARLAEAALADLPPAADDEAVQLGRLAGLAQQRLGAFHARAERLAESATAHEAALALRERHGSHAECWETAA